MTSVEIGAVREQVLIEEITPTHLVKYAGASGDFNPLHHDNDYAKSHGYPGLFGHGMFTMGLTARIITDWFGPEALASYGVRFTRQVWPGDRLTARAVVTEVTDNLATVELTTVNQDGETVIAGNAEIRI